MHSFSLVPRLALLLSTLPVFAASQAASPSFTDAATFQNDTIAAHNFYREQHGVGDLQWNDTSASFAAEWAAACNFEHSGGPTGENLAAGYANASASIDAWGLERQEYDFGDPTGFSDETGHFTQLVWGNTTTVGCGVASCQGRNGTPGFYVVCEYYPPGNVMGNENQFFQENVLEQTMGEETDTVESGTTSSGHGHKHTRNLVGAVVIAAMVGFVIAV
ncbi:uncharacterized protein L3040_008930 [Drepanopeziza brunnea f. sp. 'multigermtubi']|uniref:uncharacterized protein n=1 Tax=Drepanopeziza brunnea f. sp. 'multigermtubi' TaxID=698441 RepID=UPI00239F4187|nr:hypothetical protein L3040_008930 [Drepanopeziza brunnea f. sp. 'multigermtubi']